MDEGPGSRLNRRDLIRRGAIVVGAAWSVPVIQSITVPAKAGSAPPCLDFGQVCTDDSQCCSGFCEPFVGTCSRCLSEGSFCASTGPITCCPGLECIVAPGELSGICFATG